MRIQRAVETALHEHFQPDHLEVINESGGHNVPPGSETHFRVVVVCSDFDGQSRVRRHRAVHGALRELLDGPIHALAIETYTPEAWAERGEQATANPPPCRGGSEAERKRG